jgi:hypothetical protein
MANTRSLTVFILSAAKGFEMTDYACVIRLISRFRLFPVVISSEARNLSVFSTVGTPNF